MVDIINHKIENINQIARRATDPSRRVFLHWDVIVATDSNSTRSAARILIVDPQPAVRQVLGELLSPFYHLSLASSGKSAVEKLGKQRIDLVLTDDRLGGQVNTRELIRQTQVSFAKLPVVVLSKEKLPDDGVVGVGSCSFLSKKRVGQESGRAELLLLVERRLSDYRQERASSFRRRQHQRTGLAASSFLVGRSPQLERIREQVLRAARSGLSLLITGETGVGKTLVAENVHMASAGPTRPFVIVDPSALAPSLFESELFGHARGAFTGATTAQVGAFEAAEGGTLLLDEIGDLGLDLQRKLLRAVEERVIRRVGDVREIHLDVRVISATNRDLEADVAAGHFRADLFQRLNEERIEIPALRDRSEDVVPLMQHFMGHFESGAEVRISPGAERTLCAYRWPGNVRELRTVARRMRAAGVTDEVSEEAVLDVLPARIDRGAESDLSPDERIRVFSRRAYLDALKTHAFSLRGTARALGLPYHTLRSRLHSLDLLDAIQEHKNRSGEVRT